MKVTWLGQAGFLLEKDGNSILIDPYLSNACSNINPSNQRRIPVEEHFLSIQPDVIILTHDHIDHTDPETLKHYLPGAGNVLVLAGANAWNKVRTFGGNNNYVRFCPGTRWTWKNITFSAVKAEHSDADAIGVIVDDGSKKLYFTGDTLYNESIFSMLPDNLWAVFLPINGKGNNMNAVDAAAFALRTGAKYSVPMHFGMFDSLCPEIFPAKNRIIPEPYKSILWEETK